MTDPRIPGASIDPTGMSAYLQEAWDPREEAHRQLAGRVPPRYRDAVTTVPEVQAWVRGLVRTVDAHRERGLRITTGRSLLLVGKIGSGKTYEAYGAIRALAHSGVWFSWEAVTCADLYQNLRPATRAAGDQGIDRYLHASVLVLDDMGAAKPSEWTEEINYRLINHRYEHELPTLITSNLAPNRIAEAVGDRVASRLIEMADRVTINTPDRRRASRGSTA